MDFKLDIPVLETERLVLRGFEDRDFASFSEIYADEETARFVGGAMPDHQAWRVLASVLGHWVLRGFGLFCVEEKSSRECVGVCGPWRPHGFPDNEIGYTLKKSSHGKGYATEAATAALKFAYEQLGWTTAISLIDNKNLASQSVASKLGATNEQQDAQVNGKTCDIWRHQPSEQFLSKLNTGSLA